MRTDQNQRTVSAGSRRINSGNRKLNISAQQQFGIHLSIETKNASTGRRKQLVNREGSEEGMRHSQVSHFGHNEKDLNNMTLERMQASSRFDKNRSDHETSYRILKPRMGEGYGDSSISKVDPSIPGSAHQSAERKHRIDRVGTSQSHLKVTINKS